eukprot:393063-Rhodomonas_salina.1
MGLCLCRTLKTAFEFRFDEDEKERGRTLRGVDRSQKKLKPPFFFGHLHLSGSGTPLNASSIWPPHPAHVGFLQVPQ